MNDELTDQEISEIAPNLDPVKFISEVMKETMEELSVGFEADLVKSTSAIRYAIAVTRYGVPALPEPHRFPAVYAYIEELTHAALGTPDLEAIQQISERHPECKTMGDLVDQGLTSEFMRCYSYNPSLPGFLASTAAGGGTRNE